MAAAAGHINNMVNEQKDTHVNCWAKQKIFGDTPSAMGMVYFMQAMQFMAAISRSGTTLLANILGNDPGAGGGGNAMVNAQWLDRCQSSKECLLSMMIMASQLFLRCSTAEFPDGASIWVYLHGPLVVYLPPTETESELHQDQIKKWSFQDMPSSKQDRDLQLHWGAYLQAHNPNMHPTCNITPAETIKIYVSGSHSKVKANFNCCDSSNIVLCGLYVIVSNTTGLPISGLLCGKKSLYQVAP